MAQERSQIIQLRGVSIDTTVEVDRDAEAWGYGCYLLHFSRPADDASLEELERHSIERISYVPKNAFLVWVPEDSVGLMGGLQGRLQAIDWVSPLRPEWKVDPRLGDSAKRPEPLVVTVQLHSAPGADASVEAVRDLADEVLMDAVEKRGVIQLRLSLSAGKLQELAQVPHVLWVEKWVEPTLFKGSGPSPDR